MCVSELPKKERFQDDLLPIEEGREISIETELDLERGG